MYLLDTCTITIGEITKGIQKMQISRRRSELETWLNQDLLIQFQNRIVEIDIPTIILWGTLTAMLESQGRRLPSMDSLIAATALHGGFILVTRNEKDFIGTGVTILNPWTCR